MKIEDIKIKDIKTIYKTITVMVTKDEEKCAEEALNELLNHEYVLDGTVKIYDFGKKIVK